MTGELKPHSQVRVGSLTIGFVASALRRERRCLRRQRWGLARSTSPYEYDECHQDERNDRDDYDGGHRDWGNAGIARLMTVRLQVQVDNCRKSQEQAPVLTRKPTVSE